MSAGGAGSGGGLAIMRRLSLADVSSVSISDDISDGVVAVHLAPTAPDWDRGDLLFRTRRKLAFVSVSEACD